jgi:hypothetical protein
MFDTVHEAGYDSKSDAGSRYAMPSACVSPKVLCRGFAEICVIFIGKGSRILLRSADRNQARALLLRSVVDEAKSVLSRRSAVHITLCRKPQLIGCTFAGRVELVRTLPWVRLAPQPSWGCEHIECWPFRRSNSAERRLVDARFSGPLLLPASQFVHARHWIRKLMLPLSSLARYPCPVYFGEAQCITGWSRRTPKGVRACGASVPRAPLTSNVMRHRRH